MASPARGAASPGASARIVHASLILGVLLFVVTSWYMVRSRPNPATPADLGAFYAALCVVTVSGLLGAMVVARGIGPTGSGQTPDQWWATNLNRVMVIWALAEAPALLGGVVYLLSGDPRALLATVLGVAVMLRFAPGRLARRD